MSSEVKKSQLPIYVLCYVIWIALSGLLGVIVWQLNGLLVDLSLFFEANAWVGRAVRQLSFPILGLIWLGLVFWLEHVLRSAVPRHQLIQRTLRYSLPVLAVLAFMMLIRWWI